MILVPEARPDTVDLQDHIKHRERKPAGLHEAPRQSPPLRLGGDAVIRHKRIQRLGEPSAGDTVRAQLTDSRAEPHLRGFTAFAAPWTESSKTSQRGPLAGVLEAPRSPLAPHSHLPMPRLASLLTLFAFLGLGCAWLLWPSTEPLSAELHPQAGQTTADVVAEAVLLEQRTAVAPEASQPAVAPVAKPPRTDANPDALIRELEAVRGQVRGTVFYSADEGNQPLETYPPLPFATIEVGYWPGQDAPHRSFEIQADAAGQYSLDLARLRDLCTSAARLGEGAVRLLVTDPHSSFPGHWEALEDLVASPNQAEAPPRVIDLFLKPQPSRIVRGRVIDPHGQPIPGALVETLHGFTSDERCDFLGQFVLDSQIPSDWTAADHPAPLHLRLSDERGQSSELRIPWDEIPGDNNLGDLVLAPEFLITGTALGADGSPLPHWIVAIRADDEFGRMSKTARGDAEGRFTYSATHGATHQLYVHGFDTLPIVTTVAPRHGLEVRASSPTALLRVLDPDGEPIQSEGGWGFILCEPDAQGGWHPVRPNRGIIEDPWLDTTQLTFPEPGVYRVDTEWPGLRGTWSLTEFIEVEPGHQELELRASYTPD